MRDVIHVEDVTDARFAAALADLPSVPA